MKGPVGNLGQRVMSWLVLSQLAMAASAAALIFACSRTLDRPISPWWYAAAILGTWAVHLRDSAASCDAEDSISQPRRANLFRGHLVWSWILPGLAAAGGAVLALLAHPSLPTLILLAVVGTLGLLHALPARASTTETPANEPSNLGVKRFAAGKSVVVSITWAVAAVGLPLLEAGAGLDSTVWRAAIWMILLLFPVLFADSLLLDLRDRIADRTFGLRTIAVRVGPKGVHATVGILLGFSATMILLGGADAIDSENWRRLGLASVLGLGLVWFGWRGFRRDEAGVAFAVMSWRFIAALATI